ncbi:hypothetical protein BDQ12DRAFT_629747 [Crucibulum laeve]|uniref:NAD(P)-binding protein n=1 Tax=Crucibulum laeve TaxID=68775 RepID=A0A5C3M3N9_9AGAR|nr:hypothetical protein BDQ12DRAFT_629747 [Crucibulum laeve]
MPSVSAAHSSNAKFRPSYIPVAVFVGGTSGICQATAEAFARYTNGKAHIFIVGRNRPAAQKIIASFPKPQGPNSQFQHEFIGCDLRMMKNVRTLTKTLLERVSTINFLVFRQNVPTLGPKQESSEGIDIRLALQYYSRWVLINDLLPGLRKARELGQDAKVMSILAAGQYSKLDIDDLGLKKNFTPWKALMQTCAYNELMVAEYAKREPDIAFTHIYPGFVKTPGIYKTGHWIFWVIYPILFPFLWFLATPVKDCAESMLFALFNGEKGMFRRNQTGDDIGMSNFPSAEDAQFKLWEHTVALTTEL